MASKLTTLNENGNVEQDAERNTTPKKESIDFGDLSANSSATDSSSDDDEDDYTRPPEKISIERSADLETLKSAFSSPMKRTATLEIVDVDSQQPKICAEITSRSEADKRRVKRQFFSNNNNDSNNNNNQEQNENITCKFCSKPIYGRKNQRIKLKSGSIYHRQCFKCSQCRKMLSPQDFRSTTSTTLNSSEQQTKLFCNLHYFEQKMAEEIDQKEDSDEILDEISVDEEQADEEDYALVTQPKCLNPDVIKGGLKLEDEILSIGLLTNGNLDEKRKLFDQNLSADASSRRTSLEPLEFTLDNNECKMIRHGQVKDRLSKFEDVNHIGNGNESEMNNFTNEDEEDFKNANISGRTSSYKKREELKLDVDPKSLKSKFENSPGSEDQSINHSVNNNATSPMLELELNALKSAGVMLQVKEKFKEHQQGASEENNVNGEMGSSSSSKKKANLLEEILTPVATASIHEAKEKFMKGEAAFHPETGLSSEKFREPIPFTELSSVKERFEQQQPGGPTSDAATGCLKFNVAASSLLPTGARCAELNSLKASFEAGGKKKFSDDELEARRKKHLEMEFKRIHIEKSIFNEKQRREAEEEAKGQKTVPYQDVESIEKCKELNALKQKFEQANATTTTDNATCLVPNEELSVIDKEEAKQIKAKFESNAFEKDNQTAVDPEEKLKNIRAEFEQFKEIKQKMEEPSVNNGGQETTTAAKDDEQNDLRIAAEHAQKVRAKWDKMQRKQTKKAEKAAGIKEKISSRKTKKSSRTDVVANA